MGNFNNELREWQQISRNLINDNSMSDRARFVYCFMACKPDDWDFYMEPLAKELGYSVDTLRKYINELIDAGWLTKGEQDKIKDNKGKIKFGACKYTLHAKKVQRVSDTEKIRHGKNPAQHNIDDEHNRENEWKEKKDLSFYKKDDYMPFAAEPQQDYGRVEEEKKWREDFNAYMTLVDKAKNELLSDSEYKAYIEKYYPNADYENSVGKLVDGFWGRKEGWEYCKKKRKGKTINMLSTLKKNLDSRIRIVYKQKSGIPLLEKEPENNNDKLIINGIEYR